MSDTDDTDEETEHLIVAPTEAQLQAIHNAVEDRKVQAGDKVTVWFSDTVQVTALVLNVQSDPTNYSETAEIEYIDGNGTTAVCELHLLAILESASVGN